MKLRTYKKSQTGKILFFLFSSILFIYSSVILAGRLTSTYSHLKETEKQLVDLQLQNNDYKKNVEEIKLKEENFKTEIQQLKQKLEQKAAEMQKAYPNQTIDLNNPVQKYAYLTFDDGPSNNTPIILDFLKANDIKATFFVIGNPSKTDIYKRIVDEGHALGVHSYTHKYQEIYRSLSNFMEDIHALSDLLEKSTGVKPTILRFPGGSNNSISKKYSGYDIMEKIISKVEEEGFVYFDWNVDSADAQKANQDPNVIVNTVLNESKDKNYAIILMHDAAAKSTTAEALPAIVQGLRKQGFTFKALTADSKVIQFR